MGRSRSLWLLAAGTGGLIVLAVGFMFLVNSAESTARIDLAATMASPASEAHDFFQSLEQIHQIADAPCSPAFVEKLRGIVFSSLLVEDAAYQRDGKTLCSGLGMPFDQLQLPARPDFVAGNGWWVWSRVSFGARSAQTVTVIDTGTFLLIVRPRDDGAWPQRPDELLSWLRIGEHGRTEVVFGTDIGLTDAQLHAAGTRWTQAGIVVPACLPIGWDCYTLLVPWREIAEQHWPLLAACAASGAAGGLLVAWLAFRWMRWRYSPGRQIRIALDHNEFVLRYQPIYDAVTGRYIAAEALLRWPQPDGSTIAPDRFIPVAEEAGLIGAVTRNVLRLMSQDLGAWLVQQRDFSIEINVSPEDLDDPLFYGALDEFVVGKGILPRQISLEITERRLIEANAGDCTRRLRALGYQVLIDDFGTGYANLDNLDALSLDGVKIDRSFTVHLGDGSARSRITQAMIELARRLDLDLIAEGVETVPQMHNLLYQNVTHMQGFLFAQAVSASELQTLRPPAIVAIRQMQMSGWV